MAFQLPSIRTARNNRPAWAGMALLVESMVLLLFLIGSLAVITQVFGAATVRAQQGDRLAQAVALATNEAELFAADPADAAGTVTDGELTATCDVTSSQTPTGTLYDATITVTCTGQEEPVYVLTTSRFESEVR